MKKFQREEHLQKIIAADQAADELHAFEAKQKKQGLTENCPACGVHRGHKANCALFRADPADYSLEKYREFLRAKCNLPAEMGVPIDPGEVFECAVPSFKPKPHQIAAVLWAVRGGRRALYERFGLGKTVQQLEIERLILKAKGGRGLIVAPLGVRQEFNKDAKMLGIPAPFRTAD